jgi:hypothetical protein
MIFSSASPTGAAKAHENAFLHAVTCASNSRMDPNAHPPAPSSAAAEDHAYEGTPYDLDSPAFLQTLKDQLVRTCEEAEAAERAEAAARPPFALTPTRPPEDCDGDDADGDDEADADWDAYGEDEGDESPATPPVHVDPADRWTKHKMAAFLRALAAQQSVAAAARSVGMSRQSAYRLRNRLKGEPFDIAWEAAFQHGYDALHQAALERALHGVEVPVYHKGELVGTRRHYDERLTTFLLARRNNVGAQRLGRYGAAAEFWSERWERMLEHVETGPVVWLDDHGKHRRADDAKLSSDMIIRHALDNAEDRARFGRGR